LKSVNYQNLCLHMIEILKATKEDIPAIKKVDMLSFTDDSYPVFVLIQLLDISFKYFLVAKDNNEVVGYSIGNLIAENNRGWVLSLGVNPMARGKNIGSKLTEKLIESLENSDCENIYLTVHPDNGSALKIYRKLGFKEIDRSDNYYLDNEERIVMRKDKFDN